jgi:hypothetical protein
MPYKMPYRPQAEAGIRSHAQDRAQNRADSEFASEFSSAFASKSASKSVSKSAVGINGVLTRNLALQQAYANWYRPPIDEQEKENPGDDLRAMLIWIFLFALSVTLVIYSETNHALF